MKNKKRGRRSGPVYVYQYSLLDVMMASPVAPLPDSHRVHQLTRMYGGLHAIETAPEPTTDDCSPGRHCREGHPMKHTIIAATIAVACFPALADEWTGRDKSLHFAGGAAVAAAVTLATRDRDAGFWAGAASGLLKEVYDSTGRGHVSGKDFIVTALGAYVGSRAAGWVITPRSVTYTMQF